MPWKEVSVMSLKKEFVFLAINGNECNFSHLCRRFGISRKTGYPSLDQEINGLNVFLIMVRMGWWINPGGPWTAQAKRRSKWSKQF